MRFLIDNSAGQRIADWLRNNGHDVIGIRQLGPDPGDRAILDLSVRDNRVLVTIDTDFGELVFSTASAMLVWFDFLTLGLHNAST